eukprot:692447-Pleurochrysis_carterae.AAC.1
MVPHVRTQREGGGEGECERTSGFEWVMSGFEGRSGLVYGADSHGLRCVLERLFMSAAHASTTQQLLFAAPSLYCNLYLPSFAARPPAPQHAP